MASRCSLQRVQPSPCGPSPTRLQRQQHVARLLVALVSPFALAARLLPPRTDIITANRFRIEAQPRSDPFLRHLLLPPGKGFEKLHSQGAKALKNPSGRGPYFRKPKSRSVARAQPKSTKLNQVKETVCKSPSIVYTYRLESVTQNCVCRSHALEYSGVSKCRARRIVDFLFIWSTVTRNPRIRIAAFPWPAVIA